MVDKAIIEFDKYLSSKGMEFEGVVIGGAALLILQISNRQTKDVDLLYPTIPENIKRASENFAELFPDLQIEKDWLNNGPASLIKSLPNGWIARLQPLFVGRSLHLKTLGREDLIKTKLFAYCDRVDPDFSDLLKIKPTIEELEQSMDWVKNCDANSKWEAHVEKMFLNLREALSE